MARKKRNEEEIEAVRQLLPVNPPDEALEEIKRRQKKALLIYRAGYVADPITNIKTKMAEVRCTACGAHFWLDNTYRLRGCHAGGNYSHEFGFIDPADWEAKGSGDTCLCPECGSGAQAMHVSKLRHELNVYDTYFFMTSHNVLGHFVLLSWLLQKSCDKTGKVYYDVKRYDGAAIIDGMPIRYTGYISGYYGNHWEPGWVVRSQWRDTGDDWNEEDIFFDRDAFLASDIANSALDVYIADRKEQVRIWAYLQLWARDPQIENLVRTNLSIFIQRIIEDATYSCGYYCEKKVFSVEKAEEHFDRKKVKPHEMLGLEKHEINLARTLKINYLEIYKKAFREEGIRLTKEQIERIYFFGCFDGLRCRAEQNGFSAPTIRTLNYLERQQLTHGSLISTRYLIDYWNTVAALQGGIAEDIRYPRDLKAAHDRAVAERKIQIDLETDKMIASYSRQLDWMCFEDPETGLTIRPARSQQELIEEGKALSHCVGGYASRVAERSTAILFIRKAECPDKSFFTLEYCHGHVIQNRGKKNCERTPEVVAFEAKWLEHIKEIKEKKKNEKRDTRVQAKQRTGA